MKKIKFKDFLGQLEKLPGADILKAGIEDIESEKITSNSLLLAVIYPRLLSYGFDEMEPSILKIENPSHKLYEILNFNYGMHHSLLRRVTSFADCLDNLKRGNV